jgi:hypothetical protein
MNPFARGCLPLALVLALAAIGSGAFAGRDELLAGFENPPVAARPWVYWFIMDGNLSREGITADLEAMQRAGIGGVILMEVDAGVPRGPVKFMSPEWQELFRHAVRETQRLGLQMTLNAGPGWTGSGGPWVKPEQSMQHLVASETNVAGPARFDAVLPRPVPRKPFFGEGALPPDLEKARKDFYRDAVVLAFPTPREKLTIGDIDEKAFYLRAPYSSQPGVRPRFVMPATYPNAPPEAVIHRSQILDLTDNLSADGHLVWDVPNGNWTIMRFGRTSTGQNTRPAPMPGLGLESDKFDPKALDAHFTAFVETLLRGLDAPSKHGAGWTMLHIDSWEMSSQNWSGRFQEEFRHRRGYDPLDYLPVLSGHVVESPEISERFLWDLRQTAQELIVEKHALHLKELGRRHGFGLSIEPYDMNPCADLTLGGVADVPMCEFWAKGYGFNTEFSCLEAVSIAHTLGRPIVAAESFTSGDDERWQLYPGAMKSQTDWAFCTGINRLVIHRFQHQPWLDRVPGMTMGSIGSHWERTQTWWDLAPAYHQYLARCQFMLRRGSPVADICYLVPEGAPQVFQPPKSATRGILPDRLGYNFDGCAPEVLRDHAKMRGGRLTFPGNMSYRLLVLPDSDTATPALLRKIKRLVDDGATVVGYPPIKSPSLANYPECDAEVRRLASQIWGPDGAAGPKARQPLAAPAGSALEAGWVERRVGKGRVVWSTEGAQERAPRQATPTNITVPPYPDYRVTAELLARMNVSPDFESDFPLRYTHRRDGGMDIYLVANTTGQPVTATAWFRVAGKLAELWDPVSGERRRQTGLVEANEKTRISLSLQPYQSVFVVFGSANETLPEVVQGAAQREGLLNLLGPWEVEFQPKRGAPDHLTLEKLVDWSQHADPGVRHFSGMATYRIRFLWNSESTSGRSVGKIFLDLGRVEVMAKVRLNGHDLGVVWTAPWQVEVTRALKPGTNELEIRVANLWPNRLIGDAGLPQEQRVTWTTWNPFTKNSPLLPSGLIGPVQLLTQTH